MAFTYKEISFDEAKGLKNVKFNVFGEEAFLKSLAETYSCNIKYVIVLNENEVIICSPICVLKRSIKSFNHYYYHNIWIHPDLEKSWKKIEALEFLISQLTNKYDKIEMKLPIDFKDIRVFTWNKFEIKTRYTYLKELNFDNDYHPNIQRILKKDLENYSFEINKDWDESLNIHSEDLKSFGLDKVFYQNVINQMKYLGQNKVLYTFNAYNNSKFVTSILVILDNYNKRAYFPFIGKSNHHYNNGLPAHLYNYTFMKLKDMGVNCVDLFGANIPSIARFKQKFNPKLVVYYDLSYKKEGFIKKYLMKFLNKL